MSIYQPEQVNIWAIFLLDLVREFSRPFLNLILIVLFFFFVVRPLLNWLKHEMEPAGSGAEAPVLPEYPGGARGFMDSLPLPTTPPATESAIDVVAPASEALDDNANRDYIENPPNYDEQEETIKVEENQGPLPLTYGNLSKDNILPIARENLERTVGLVRSWVDEKPPPDEEPKI